ncbi:MAG: aldo/keto reductase [Paracoccaceae bacterium]
MPPVPTMTFRDGRKMPQLGFGLWQVPGDQAARVVGDAVAAGYRMADGAAIYGNEAGLGQGVRDCGLPRTQIFVTTKVWNDRQGFDSTLAAVDESLARLGLAFVDLMLIHWPCPAAGKAVETWRALIRARDEGKCRSIGVSNFRPEDLERIVDATGEVPVLNQIEIHPRLQQAEARALHDRMGIVTQSWSPLGRGLVLDTPEIAAIAARLGKSPAQVVLRWHVQSGLAVIPRSTRAAGLAENIDVFDFALSEDDMGLIAGLETGQRTGPDPATFG